MTNEDTCEVCGREPAPGVWCVLVVVSLFWLIAGMFIGKANADKQAFHKGFVTASMDTVEIAKIVGCK